MDSHEEYWNRFTITDKNRGDLGGNLRHGDTKAILPSFWRYLVERFAVRSVLDVGCGEGHALNVFHRLGVVAHGIDGLQQNVENATFPIALHDLSKSPYIYPCDMVYCVEVVEHIKIDFIDFLMSTLTNAPVVIMTHGVPGQLGYHHVNLQTSEYWIQKFHEHGYTLSIDNDHFKELASREVPGSYFSDTGLVFLKN
ncbi:methyltransferase domain-containing protein [Pseudomonadota bacterium]